MKQYSQYIGASNGVHHLTSANGNTKDIMNTVLFADGKAHEYCRALAAQLNVPGDPVQTCYNIWKFWKENVKYIEDPDGWQFIKSPAYLYETAEGDCKSYSVAVGSCLKQLGIPYAYRFISQDANKPFHHVYIVAYTKAGQVLIDCVIDLFNKENPYARKRDVPPANQHAPQPTARIGKAHGIHYIPSHIGATQAESVASTWQQYEEAFKAQSADFVLTTKQQARAAVDYKYKNQPMKKAAALKAFEALWPATVTASSCLVYAYWDQQKAPFPFTHSGTQQNLTDKRKTALDFYNNLKDDVGCTDSIIKRLAQIGCYNMHGITLEYMLYRCYNMVNYGQPWEPVPGVPYYDFKTGTFVNQGNTAASLQMTLKIAMCFPAAGGISRPWGVPYWSVGGWYMRNGYGGGSWKYDQATLVNAATRSANELAHTANNGAGISAAAMDDCYNVYSAWLNGNLPALPSVLSAPGGSIPTPQSNQNTTVTPYIPPVNAGGSNTGEGEGSGGFTPNAGVHGFRRKAKIGDPVTAIVGCVIAAVTAIVSIIVTIIKLVKDGQNVIPPPGSAIPNPPPDFKMEFQTVDGCFIGTAPAECGPGKAKYCPDGSFKCLTAAELLLPENQQGMPAGGFLGGGRSKWLWIGAAALLAVFFFSGSKSKN